MKKSKLKASALTIGAPHNREEADKLIYALGELQRDRIDLGNAMNEALAAVKLEHEDQAKPINEKISATMASLQAYCEANRAALCPRESKTVKFGNGEVSWRRRPPKVTLRSVEKMIAWCKKHGMAVFVRIKEEINKEAMLADPTDAAKVPGVTIGSAGEDFIVKPLQSELEEIFDG